MLNLAIPVRLYAPCTGFSINIPKSNVQHIRVGDKEIIICVNPENNSIYLFDNDGFTVQSTFTNSELRNFPEKTWKEKYTELKKEFEEYQKNHPFIYPLTSTTGNYDSAGKWINR